MTSAGWWKIKGRFFCRNVVRLGNAISSIWWVFLLSGWIMSGKLYGQLLLFLPRFCHHSEERFDFLT